MRNRVRQAVEEALARCAADGALEEAAPPDGHQISVPKHEAHGDFSSNIALVLASRMGKKPREVAELIAQRLEASQLFSKVEVAGPGFINMFVRSEVWQEAIKRIVAAGSAYGCSNAGGGVKVLVEFVSANPTGPLHVGHGRGAAVGDSLARILRAAGYDVTTEYYVNDAGNQMRTLGLSVFLRYRELLGETVDFPDHCYQGEYIKEIAASILEEEGERLRGLGEEAAVAFCTDRAVEEILAGIKADLDSFDVGFDNWFSERTLHASGKVEQALEELKAAGHLYEQDGALWFRSTAFGDEKDRVVRRSNGDLTYFAADIAYHKDKLDRGFELLVDIWGADHHGYVPRVKAAISALGGRPQSLHVLLVQLVNLMEAGEKKAMSTRAGEFVTLKAVLDEVGRDAARFIFLTRKCDSHLDFDLDLARQQSQENPVYYVQYAHARLCSVFRKAREQGVSMKPVDEIDTSLLKEKEEMEILQKLDSFPFVVAESAKALEPHRISFYLTELAAMLHGYYTKFRFISGDAELTQARLLLAQGARQVVQNGLHLLGVSAPETM